MSSSEKLLTVDDLPGLDCGLCGYRNCGELAAQLPTRPELLQRCIHMSDSIVSRPAQPSIPVTPVLTAVPTPVSCGVCAPNAARSTTNKEATYQDTLGRDFDFYLDCFPEEPGPRETIIPHNPMLTRELEIQPGDVLIGRPLGMSCGCPITHCGITMEVDRRTGVIVWCVTGPLKPRQQGYKDLGYYIAEGYEGLVLHTRTDVEIGAEFQRGDRPVIILHGRLHNEDCEIGAFRIEGLDDLYHEIAIGFGGNNQYAILSLAKFRRNLLDWIALT